jgi:hypothetical protein
MEAYYLSAEKAIELLNDGNTLTQPGIYPNTLKKVGETYSWKGLRDIKETILEAKDLDKKFFQGKVWVIQ